MPSSPPPGDPPPPVDPVAAADASDLARGAGVLMVGRVLGRGLGFGAHMVMSRTLGAEGYGLFAVGFRLFLLLGLVAPLGLDQGIIRYGAPLWRSARPRFAALARRSLFLATASGAGLALLLALAAPLLARRVWGEATLAPVLRTFAVAVVLAAVLRVTAAATRASQEMRYSVAAEDVAQPVGQFLLVAGLAAWGGWGAGLGGALAALVVSYALAAGLGLAFLAALSPAALRRPAAPPSAPVATRELMTFSVPTALAGVLTVAAMWVDVLLVGALRGAAETGVYQAASQIAFLFTLILTSFNGVFAPMIADRLAAGERRRLEASFRLSVRWGLYLGLPLFAAFAVEPAGLLALVMGPEYASGGVALRLLAGGQMVNLATGAVAFLLLMSGRQNEWLAGSALALVANVALNLAWIPRFGIEGAAAATALTVSVLFLAALVRVRSALGLWPWDRALWKAGAAAALAAAAGWAARAAVGGGDAASGVAVAAAVAASFWTCLLALGFEERDRELGRRLAARFRRRP